jgi:uncharacterized protein DUF4007
MGRGPLYQADHRPLFSGHETFPLRYGWLKKAYDAVSAHRNSSSNKSIFLSDEAIARFGVGKNMVASMRHWATCSGVIAEEPNSGQLTPTPVGNFLFGPKGVDPYLEDHASLWHLHWLLCSGESGGPLKTTWFWVFSHFTSVNFRRDDLVDGLIKLAEARSWRRLSRTTVQRDVECFVRMYETHPSGSHGAVEDNLESPLAELRLVLGQKGHFHLVRGAKPSLPNGVFVKALDAFWNRHGSTRTLSFEMVAHEPGSPGRVFLLDEPELADRLLALEDITKGTFRWSETAGLKQVIRNGPLREAEASVLLQKDYRVGRRREAG